MQSISGGQPQGKAVELMEAAADKLRGRRRLGRCPGRRGRAGAAREGSCADAGWDVPLTGGGICEGLKNRAGGRFVLLHARWVGFVELVHPGLALWAWLGLRVKHQAACERPGSASWAKEEGGEFPPCCFSSCLGDKGNLPVGEGFPGQLSLNPP